MPYPLNKIVADSDRHAQVTNNLKLAKERQSLQANKRRNQPPRWQSAQQVMLASQNMNLTHVNKKMKPRCQGPFPITRLKHQCNQYSADPSSNADLRHIQKPFT